METVLAAEQTGLSITFPKISPDGRSALVTMSKYGCFPIHHSHADLYMVDLETGSFRRLAINSDRCESYHSWSTNGRWIVFSSKRWDDLLARPFFAYVDEDGKVYEPLVLPLEGPPVLRGVPEDLQHPRAGG